MSRCKPDRGDARTRLKRAALITRSGAQRYPREIVKAIREPGAHLRDSTGWTVPDRLNQNATEALGAVWLGHATVLLRLNGKWVLTDPVFSKRVGLRLGPWTVGPERLAAAPAHPDDLPQIDVVLVSHAHYDHLDRPSLKRLMRKETVVVTAAKTRRLIPRGFGERIELAWDEEVDVGGLTIRALQPSHWGARWAWDRHRGYNSYVMSSASQRVLFAGDSAMTDVFAPLGRDGGGVDLGIFGIGAYDPWIHAHATPEQVWQMAEQAGARYILPMHHSTFRLSNEAVDEPMRRLIAAAGRDHGRIITTAPGELWMSPREADGVVSSLP